MTALEKKVLTILRARPAAKVFEIGRELRLDVQSVEAALRQLERAGRAERGQDQAHVVVWAARGRA